MNIRSNNTFIKDICLSLGFLSKYDQDELENNSYVLSDSINTVHSNHSVSSYGLIYKNKLIYRELETNYFQIKLKSLDLKPKFIQLIINYTFICF